MKKLFLSAILLSAAWVLNAQETKHCMDHHGTRYAVPADFIDPFFPADIHSSAYQSYVSTHLFPLPEEGDYERRLEIWVKNNRYFPQFLNTGNSTSDSVRYSMAVEVWKQKNPEAVAYITSTINTTGLSQDDFNILLNSFPRKTDYESSPEGQQRYTEAVAEWIRIYSYEKYELIEPIVRNAESVKQNAEEGK